MKGKLIKTDKGYILEGDNLPNPRRLSLKNCESIENGYDLDELAMGYDLYENINFVGQMRAFKVGFQKAIELMGDKKFSEEDMGKAWSEGYHRKVDELNGNGLKYFDKFIQSLQPTEWDVEILMEKDEPKSFVKRNVIRKLEYGEEIEWTCFWDNGWFDSGGIAIPNVISWERLPILDKNDCLILKRV